MSNTRENPGRVRHWAAPWAGTSLALALAACGGGGGDNGGDNSFEPTAASGDAITVERAAAFTPPSASVIGGTLADQPTSQRDAVRLADQASFGPTEALNTEIRTKGAAKWISAQMATPPSYYVSGGGPEVHQWSSATVDFCAGRGSNCWNYWYGSTPLLWDFYRNAVEKPDQLRQRVAFALQQFLVVSNTEVEGTYGLRNYYNALVDEAFGNYRNILKKVALSPVMGMYLDNANNSKTAPNENFARELLQLFSLGTCELNTDGTLRGGNCVPTYNNEQVRDYAHALTGWTYPAGGVTSWGCWPQGANCRYFVSDMIPLASFHDTEARTLLSGVSLPGGHSASQALEAVLDSIMKHPNIGPFIGRQLIQHLVTSNPSPAYVQRVANAFNSGRFQGFGASVRGDMKATIAAVLLDPEARNENPDTRAGRLREPAQFMVGMVRALNGRTDGNDFAWWWGEGLRQHVFRSPSVFNFYETNYSLPGSGQNGGAFGIHSVSTALGRMNFISYLLYWGGSAPDASVPNAVGTRNNLASFQADAGDPAKLVDRLSMLALGQPLPATARTEVIRAVSSHSLASSGTTYLLQRIQTATYLVFGSPYYQVIR